MKRSAPPERPHRHSRRSKLQPKTQPYGCLILWGIMVTPGVGCMAWVFFKDPPPLAGAIVVAIVLGLLGMLGIACLYSGIMALVDQLWDVTREEVVLIGDKKIVTSTRRQPRYLLIIERGAAVGEPYVQPQGFWHLFRNYRVMSVESHVYHQAVPGKLHRIIQGRWGRIVYEVVPLRE